MKTVLASAFIASIAISGTVKAQDVVFLSTQFRPVEEAQKVRSVLLKNAPHKVDFVGEDDSLMVTRAIAEKEGKKVSVALYGALHGQMAPMVAAGVMKPVDDIIGKLDGVQFDKALIDLGKFGTDKQYFVPWMQATFIMVAHKDALKQLPPGADLSKLTYTQLIEWGRNLEKATGKKQIGLPAGPKGLLHRFLQGYTLPAYSGSALKKWRSPDAQKMWADLKALWSVTNPASTNYGFMNEPLMAGDVMVAWDHVARLLPALSDMPTDFVAFPAPAGPKGRAFMPVLAGFSLPEGGPAAEKAVDVMRHLLSPKIQAATLVETGFFPVVKMDLPSDLPAGVRNAAGAITAMQGSADALPALIPAGLGSKNGEFNKVFFDTFTQIVVQNQDISKVLDDSIKILNSIVAETKAPCWAPDPAGSAPCMLD
ncbi:ABC transporter substrate-binding protein [Microvirga lotononidis]|uniref:ABC-type sugar transport system, periplasmic component n=1 Tax=Microvirga lotononidis TaxID=864069 RepID=I4YXI0_9HYPH|nr:ABC transporter substrate-binding protein [Microvirga lotononidis]EIM28672.1 ABC-type sugar transport system, periplasmic component [Microvirga lotononidis]WQO25587.1 ABC transporter substrate-binding protein [Microvirga lotononidis]